MDEPQASNSAEHAENAQPQPQSNELNAERVRRLKSRNLIFAILSLSVCCSIPATAILGSQATFNRVSDFPEYYGATRMICTGRGADIYKLDRLFAGQHEYFPGMEGRGVGFYIPPFAAVLLAPLGLPAPTASYFVYMLASILSLIAGILLLGKHFKMQAESLVWFATIVFATSPSFESLKIAQLAPFLFLSLSSFLLLAGKGKDLAAGACLSVLLLKPQELLPLAVYLLFARRFKIIASLAAVFALATLVSLWLLGTDGYTNYFALLRDSAANTQFMQPELSATVRGQLLRLGVLGHQAANLLSSLLLAAALAFIALAAHKFGRRGASFESGLLRFCLPLGLMNALHCHDYDLLLLAPWVISCFGLTANQMLVRATQIALFLLIAAYSVPVYVPIHYDYLIHQAAPLNPLFLLFAAAALLSSAEYLSCQKSCKDKTAAQDEH